jgi:hypothetical protein
MSKAISLRWASPPLFPLKIALSYFQMSPHFKNRTITLVYPQMNLEKEKCQKSPRIYTRKSLSKSQLTDQPPISQNENSTSLNSSSKKKTHREN